MRAGDPACCSTRPARSASATTSSPIAPDGFEAQADWATLESPETYLGYEQAQNFASPGGAELDEARTYAVPDPLKLNQWALVG